FGNRCTMQLVFPRIDQPHPRVLSKLCSEIKGLRPSRIFEAVSQGNFRRRASPFLILEFAPVEPNQVKKLGHEAMRKWHLEVISALWSHDALAINDELIAFRFAAEHGMVVKNEAGELRTAIFLEEQRRGEAAHSSANHNAVEGLACINRVWRQ